MQRWGHFFVIISRICSFFLIDGNRTYWWWAEKSGQIQNSDLYSWSSSFVASSFFLFFHWSFPCSDCFRFNVDLLFLMSDFRLYVLEWYSFLSINEYLILRFTPKAKSQLTFDGFVFFLYYSKFCFWTFSLNRNQIGWHNSI